jgi:hypothetical protein
MQHGCRIGTGGQETPLAWVNSLPGSLGGRQVHQARCVKQLHEPLIGAPGLGRREVQVLVEDRGQAPLLQLPQAPDDAASPVLKENNAAAVRKVQSKAETAELECKELQNAGLIDILSYLASLAVDEDRLVSYI